MFSYTRAFFPDAETFAECELAGLPEGLTACGDAWEVRIFDANGEPVSVILPAERAPTVALTENLGDLRPRSDLD